jgi:hypothetical protein
MSKYQADPALRASDVRRPVSAAPHQIPLWQQALESDDPAKLRALNAWHLAAFPGLAPAFGDLKGELRFSDDGEHAKAAYIYEVLARVRAEGEGTAAAHCQRIINQLEREHARRHPNAWLAA